MAWRQDSPRFGFDRCLEGGIGDALKVVKQPRQDRSLGPNAAGLDGGDVGFHLEYRVQPGLL